MVLAPDVERVVDIFWNIYRVKQGKAISRHFLFCCRFGVDSFQPKYFKRKIRSIYIIIIIIINDFFKVLLMHNFNLLGEFAIRPHV